MVVLELEFAVSRLFELNHQASCPLAPGIELSTLPAHNVYPGPVRCFTS